MSTIHHLSRLRHLNGSDLERIPIEVTGVMMTAMSIGTDNGTNLQKIVRLVRLRDNAQKGAKEGQPMAGSSGKRGNATQHLQASKSHAFGTRFRQDHCNNNRMTPE